MKKKIVSLLLFILCLLPCVYAEISYIGLEFTKPSYDYIKAYAENKGTHITFGNPNNDGKEQEIANNLYIDYSLQSPGSMYVFFSSKNDLGYDQGQGTYLNPFMLAAQGITDKGVNYWVTATANVDGAAVKTPETPFQPEDISAAIPEGTVHYLDIGTTPGNPSAVKSGVVVRHHFSQEDIDAGVLFNSQQTGPDAESKKGYLTGQDIITITMHVNKNSLPNKQLPSGLYYGYIVVHYTAD